MDVFISSAESGIHRYRLNAGTGTLTDEKLFAPLSRCQFFTHDARCLYAVNETNGESAMLSVFSLDSGELLSQQPTGGIDACYVSLGNHTVYVTNYSGKNVSGTVRVFSLLADGRLGESTDSVGFEGSSVHPERQQESHPHMTAPIENRVLITDLGSDHLWLFKREGGFLVHPLTIKTAPGAGPRHFALHPLHQWLYVVNELNNTVTVYANSTWDEIQTVSILPEDFNGESYAADLHVHPSGGFLYVSNRGHDSITIFTIDSDSGRLSLLGHEPSRGHWPRSFSIDATGAFMVVGNQLSDNVTTFHIDPVTGALQHTGQILPLTKPLCVKA